MQIKRMCVQARSLVVVALTLSAASLIAAQQRPRAEAGREVFTLGRGMSLITIDLIQIAGQSDLFLRFGGKIDLTKEQQTKLEEMYFEIQKYSVRQQAGLDVADAEMRRLVTGDTVNLAAVLAKVREIEAIQTEATVKKIETILKAINTLTHAQHLKVMLLVRELQNQSPPGANSFSNLQNQD